MIPYIDGGMDVRVYLCVRLPTGEPRGPVATKAAIKPASLASGRVAFIRALGVADLREPELA